MKRQIKFLKEVNIYGKEMKKWKNTRQMEFLKFLRKNVGGIGPCPYDWNFTYGNF